MLQWACSWINVSQICNWPFIFHWLFVTSVHTGEQKRWNWDHYLGKSKEKKNPVIITLLSQLYWYQRPMYLWPKLWSLNVSVYSAYLDTAWKQVFLLLSENKNFRSSILPLSMQAERRAGDACSSKLTFTKGFITDAQKVLINTLFVLVPPSQKCTGFYLQDAVDLMRRFSDDPICFLSEK